MSETLVDTKSIDSSKRTWMIASGCAGAVGGLVTAIPFVSTFQPSERAKAAGAAVEVDIAAIKPGEKLTVEWRGKPVWVVRRTPEMLASLKTDTALLADPDSNASVQPAYAKNTGRASNEEYLVLLGVCTHLGCSPSAKFTPGDVTVSADWPGGFYCPCHGSKFDLAGRVFKGVPAPLNLAVPPYTFASPTKIVVGADAQAA